MRHYGCWAGKSDGTLEDETLCAAEVSGDRGFMPLRQCSRKRGKGPDGLYCGIHAGRIAKGLRVYTPRDRKESESK